MNVEGKFLEFVKTAIRGVVVDSDLYHLVERLIQDELRTSAGNRADHYVMKQLYDGCVERTGNERFGVVGTPENMIAYATSSHYKVFVYNTPDGAGWFVMDDISEECAAPQSVREGLVFLQSVINQQRREPSDTVALYMQHKHISNPVQEFLRIAYLTGEDLHSFETKILPRIMAENKEMTNKVASIIEADFGVTG